MVGVGFPCHHLDDLIEVVGICFILVDLLQSFAFDLDRNQTKPKQEPRPNREKSNPRIY